MKNNYRVAAWFAAACSLVAACVAFTFWSYDQIEKTSGQRKTSRNVMAAAGTFMDRLMDAETGQRGYVLTGEEAYLQPYSAIQANLRSDLQALRQSDAPAAAREHLDALVPLLDAKIVEMERAIALRRDHNMAGVMALINSNQGKRSMDAIRAELLAFNRIQEDAQLQGMALFDTSMRRMFAIIVCISVLALLLALYFAYTSYRAARQRLKDAVHLETQHLLAIQTESNRQLLLSNISLQISQEKLAITLNCIGDAVIATDATARITLINPVAEALTGWVQAQALGRPLDEVFRIIGKDSRQPVALPVTQVLALGTVQGMTNHTLLIARDGNEVDIADSCAPIRDAAGEVIGTVLVFRDVTRDHAARQALRDSTTQVEAILNTVVDGIVTFHAQGGYIQSANAAVAQMFGYSAQELLGLVFNQLIPELDAVGNDVPLDYLLAPDGASARGQLREARGRHKDGHTFPLEMAFSEMTLGGERYFTGMLRDITARKHNEMALRKASALQHATFNSANFSYIATDAAGTIQVFNVGAEVLLGYSAADMVGKTSPDSFCAPRDLMARAQLLRANQHTEISPGFEALVYQASRGIEDIFELTYLHRDGGSCPVVVSVTALRDDTATVIGYLFIGIDNRTRRRLEVERLHLDQVLRDRNLELESARAGAELANQAKSEFLSNMSHELRSPLNAILGFAQLMETGKPTPTPEQKGSIEQILKAGWYLLELINEVLDLALVESGRLSMSMEPVLLPEVLADCQTLMEPIARKRDIRMQFPTFDTPTYVEADRTRLKQVLLNLLSNAIKYNQLHGSVEINCIPMGHGRIQIRIRDSGPGLSPAKMAQLFQPFNRLGQEGGTEEGTGIGLVVSKRLVELMGGEIGADSSEGKGSEFWFALHMAQPPRVLDTQHAMAQDPVARMPEDCTEHTVLYVEDNVANMELVARLIARRPNLRLLRATDGISGVALARNELPDLILMDINLPVISGLEALHMLHEDPATRHIPVMALSANAMPREMERAIESGFFCYLTKPIRLGEFMDALDEGLVLAEKVASSRRTRDLPVPMP